MVASLIGVRNKIRRANDHLSQLKKSIDDWGRATDTGEFFTHKFEPERNCIVLSHGKVRANDPDWPLLVGDIVHNLRSALDHLVCQLAILSGNHVSCCSDTFFPICIRKSDFKKAKRMIEPLLRPEAFTCIEELQPYHTANIAGSDPITNNLWIINKLDIIDKHRMLVIVGKYFRVTDISCSFNDGEPIDVAVDGSWKPLGQGAGIAEIDMSRFTPKPSPDDKMKVQGGTQVQVFITETGTGCDGVEAGAAMIPCIRYVSEIVDFFEKTFFV